MYFSHTKLYIYIFVFTYAYIYIDIDVYRYRYIFENFNYMYKEYYRWPDWFVSAVFQVLAIGLRSTIIYYLCDAV